MTLGDWSQQWLREFAPRWHRNTTRNYVASMRVYWLPDFGDVQLEALCRKPLRAHLLRLASEGLAPRTVGNALATLRSCLSAAVDAELLALNPALGLGRTLGRRNTVRPIVVLRGDQLRALLAAAKDVVPEYHVLLATLAWAGLRIGEACGLQWDDVDLAGRCLHVRRTVGDSGAGPPKSGQARAVDLSAALAGLLASLPRVSRWVFPRPNDPAHPADQRVVNESLRRAAVAAGIPGHLTCHSLRHSYTSALIMCDVNLEWLRQQLGHADLRLISTVYGHGRLRDLAALDRLAGRR